MIPLSMVVRTAAAAAGDVASPAFAQTDIDAEEHFVAISCPADCNSGGDLNVLDFVCLRTRFIGDDLAADGNKEGRPEHPGFCLFQGGVRGRVFLVMRLRHPRSM